ncbi:MAG: FliH/SctL family protein [Pseudomonadota bacterium]
MSDSHESAELGARWLAPHFDAGRGPLSEATLQARHKEGYAAGFDAGRSAGLSAGRQQLADTLERLEHVLGAFAEPLDQLEREVDEALLEFATRLAGQLVRRELQLDASHVVGVLREALRALPIAEREVAVRLHPRDASIVRDAYALDERSLAWQLVEDTALEPGDVIVAGEHAQVDARLQTRIDRTLADLLADERE